MKRHSFEERLVLVRKVVSGYPLKRLAKETGVSCTSLRDWVRVYEQFGTERLRLLSRPSQVSASEKERMCRLYLEKGVPLPQIYIPNNVSRYALKSWIRKVRDGGYDALYGGCRYTNRPSGMIQSENEILREELRKAQHENLVLRAENALLKKARALMEEEESRLRSFGQEPSKH